MNEELILSGLSRYYDPTAVYKFEDRVFVLYDSCEEDETSVLREFSMADLNEFLQWNIENGYLDADDHYTINGTGCGGGWARPWPGLYNELMDNEPLNKLAVHARESRETEASS